MSKIKLGDEVKDVITGFTGIVTAETNYLSGARSLEVQKQISEDNKYPPSTWITENYLERVGDGVHVEPIKKELGFQAGEKK